MKAMRTFVVILGGSAIIAAMVGTFLMYRGVVTKSTAPTDSHGVVGQYEQLISSLSKRGDTNSATGVTKLVTAMQSGRAVTDVAMTVRILENLRGGRTNEAMLLLESRLDGAIMSFDEPSGNSRDQNHDSVLRMAKEYRSKFPYKEGVLEIDSVVERVFESVPK